MQTDTWLTDTAYTDRCPLCSQPLVGGSNTCSSCGFTAHEPAGKPAPAPVSRPSNPITPIPARASARRIQSRPGTAPRRAASEAVPSVESTTSETSKGGFSHESPSYKAASSLTSLSLIISETPTAPPRASRSTGRLDHIDEIDTVPEPSGRTRAVQQAPDQVSVVPSASPEASASLRFADLAVPERAAFLAETTPSTPFSHIDEIDTIPEVGSPPTRAVAPLRSTTREVAVDAASWTADPTSASSSAARLIASRSPRHRRRTRVFNPFDRTRWWLLRPGRIEFLLWTVGSVLLFGITFLLLLATVLSLMVPGLPVSGNFPTSTVNTSTVVHPVGTFAGSTGLHLTLSGKSSLAPGTEMHLQGKGFRAQSKVVFLLDGHLPLLNQHGQAASIQTDAAGQFVVKLWLGQGVGWSAGSHLIFAREITSGHQVTIAITITTVSATSVTGNTGAQNTPVPPINPTPTPIPPTPTPVPPTPVPPTPTTQVPASTPTAQVPVSTPTAGTPPSSAPPPAAPTRGTTMTPAGTATPASGSVDGSSSLGNALNNEDNHSLLARLAHLNPLVWLIGVCYFISMVLLGLAGLLRRRR
ncbi:MAG TPA: hypothetical protein VGM01_01740 [Ktedonobacteraceae bacterium]